MIYSVMTEYWDPPLYTYFTTVAKHFPLFNIFFFMVAEEWRNSSFIDGSLYRGALCIAL